MIVTVGEKTIEAKIMESEQAAEKYNDALASGHSAALL